MKRELIFIFAMIAVIVAGSVTMIYTQTREESVTIQGAGSPRVRPEFPPPGFGPGGPGGFHGRRDPVDQLNLTTEQRQQIEAIRFNGREAASEYESKLRGAEDQLRMMVEGGNFDLEKARPLVRAKSEAMSSIELVRLSGEAEIQRLLTTEQKAQIAQMREARPPFPPEGSVAPPPNR